MQIASALPHPTISTLTPGIAEPAAEATQTAVLPILVFGTYGLRAPGLWTTGQEGHAFGRIPWGTCKMHHIEKG
jgi:hypothetical protein